MRIVFLAPHFPAEMPHFTRALAQTGARVYGIGSDPLAAVPPRVRGHLVDYLQLPSLLDEERAAAELLPALRDLRPDRIETLWEPLVLLAARLRDALGVRGMSRPTVLGFRDKGIMKDRLRAAGVRVPHSARATTASAVREAARAIGFPLVIKPIAGAGSADTFRVDSAGELEAGLERIRHVAEVSVEEYIGGDELTYDAVSVGGQPLFDSIAEYFPRPIVGRSEHWVSPAQVVYRTPHQPALADGVALGRRVLQALGMETGFTHMEWFRAPDGECVVGEIAARAPGAKLVDMMNYANDFDVFACWAEALVHGRTRQTAHRRYHVACVFKRAEGDGRIRAIHGMDAVRQRCGRWLVADELLPLGHPRRNWKATLLSDGCVIVRHPELAECRAMMEQIVSGVRLHAAP